MSKSKKKLIQGEDFNAFAFKDKSGFCNFAAPRAYDKGWARRWKMTGKWVRVKFMEIK